MSPVVTDEPKSAEETLEERKGGLCEALKAELDGHEVFSLGKENRGETESRVCCCPPKWPTGFYWYSGNKLSRGGVPRWLEKLLSRASAEPEDEIVPAESTEDTTPPEDEKTAKTSDALIQQEEESEPTNDANQELLEMDQITDRGVLPIAR